MENRFCLFCSCLRFCDFSARVSCGCILHIISEKFIGEKLLKKKIIFLSSLTEETTRRHALKIYEIL